MIEEVVVTEPFVWLSTYQANPEMLDEYKDFCQRVVDLVAEKEQDMFYDNDEQPLY